MAKIVCLTAGLVLSAALAMAPARATVDCKANPGNAACPTPKTAGTSAQPKPQAAPVRGPAKPQTAAKGSAPKPLSEPHAVGAARQTGTANGKSTAKPAASSPAPAKLARRSARYRRILAGRDGRREKPPVQEALGAIAPPYPEHRPHSGPVYDMPPDVAPPAMGCDEVCQYRDWLNRYAAWYRDFGRYYYGAGTGGMMPNRPAAPPPSPGTNDTPRAFAAPAQPDQSERDRMDPWHGYNRHNGLGNGY